MPLMRCQRNGKRGWKFGKNGTCYIGSGSKQKAAKQGAAIKSSQRSDDTVQNELIRRRALLGKTKHSLKKPPKFILPIGIEIQYRTQLLRMIRFLEEQIKQIVFSALPSLVEERDASVPRIDAWADNAENVIGTLKVSVEATSPFLPATLAQNIGQLTAEWNDKQWRKIMKGVLGVNIFQREPWLQDVMSSFTKENVALITSIKDDNVTKIEGWVQRGLKNGDRAEQIQKTIRNQFKVTRNRAKLIARDQVSKLNAQITRFRQESLGVGRYTWRTSQDERVRTSHKRMNGKMGRWDNPTVYSDNGGKTWKKRSAIGAVQLHPGMDIQCRCTAEPVLEGLIEV